MKRLIAAILTATAMALAACTATAGTDPSATTGATTSTSSATSVTPTASGPTTTDPIESWLSGTKTSTEPTSSSIRSNSSRGSVDPTTATTAGTGDVYDAIPVTIPSTVTGAALEAANAAIPVWRNAMRVFDESLQDPGGKDWKSGIHRYANDPAALTQMALIKTFVKQGIHQVGETGYTAEVFDADTHNVKIRACLDFTSFDVIDGDGRSVVKEGALQRLRRDYWLGFYQKPNVWYVNYVDVPDPAQPC